MKKRIFIIKILRYIAIILLLLTMLVIVIKNDTHFGGDVHLLE